MKENKGMFLCYPPERPDNTLVRITGPMMGSVLISLIKLVVNLE